MRIGMLLSGSLPPRDGIGFYVWNLAAFLRDRGHEVQLITRGGLRSASTQNIDDVILHRLPYLPLYPFHLQLYNWFVSRLVQRLRASLDLLHLHSPLVLPPQTDLPLLVTFHSRLGLNPALNARFDLPLVKGIERSLMQRGNRITAVSEKVSSQLEAVRPPQKAISIMGTGVFTDFFVPAPPRIFMPEKPVFLSVGHLSPDNGFREFIRACQKVHFVYPQVRFMLIGGGPQETDLRSEILRAGLDGVVRLVGAVTDRLTLSIFYQNAYAYVNPSRGDYLSTAMLEAMSCGKAVVAASVPSLQGVIEPDRNGLLVPSGRSDEMARAMLRLVESPEMANSLGQSARSTVEQNFSWEMIGERYLAEYQALLEQGV